MDCCQIRHGIPEGIIPVSIQIAGTHFRFDHIPKWFLFWRFLLFLTMTWITAFSLWTYDEGEMQYYPIYLTFWTQTLCLITCLIRFISTLCINMKCCCNQLAIDRMYKIQSILSRTCLPMITLVMINYWVFVSDGWPWSKGHTLSTYQVHGINALLMWCDYLLSAERMYYRSAIWSIVFGSIYEGWTLIFEFVRIDAYYESALNHNQNTNNGGYPYVYEVTDWSDNWKLALTVYFISISGLLVVTALAACSKNMILRKRFKSMDGVHTKPELLEPRSSSQVNRSVII